MFFDVTHSGHHSPVFDVCEGINNAHADIRRMEILYDQGMQHNSS